MTYITDIQAFPEVSVHDTTRHDITSHPDVWQLRA